MKLAITSTLGDPRQPRTWSAAPSNLIAALADKPVEITAIDSSLYSKAGKAWIAARALLAGAPIRSASWLEHARRDRANLVALRASEAGVDHVLCCGTLDVPLESSIPYSIWLDNDWNLLRKSAVAPAFPASVIEQIDALERTALNGASSVLAFSEHVRDDIIRHYGVDARRVHAVGCGSGEMTPFTGSKAFQSGHLIFVAKHLFAEKGGELALEAFRMVRAQRPETRMVIVGTDEMAERYADVDGLEVFGFIPREKLNALFHDAAMLVQPMIADPWGQVYLEAMKAKTIVVSLNRAALPELSEGGTLAALVDNPDPAAIAGAILAVYSRSDAANNAITDRAQERVLTLYNWDRVSTNILDGIATGRAIKA